MKIILIGNNNKHNRNNNNNTNNNNNKNENKNNKCSGLNSAPTPVMIPDNDDDERL